MAMTVKQVADAIIAKTGVIPLPEGQTCDKLISGEWSQTVTKIASTFMATASVIEKAADVGVDMIITHEPTWFTGKDTTEWLLDDPVYLEKKRRIDSYGIAVWRFHDHMHMATEDGIYRGFNREFAWEQYMVKPSAQWEHFGGIYEIPSTTLGELALTFKKKLEMNAIRIVGNPANTVSRVGVLVGGGSLGLGVEEMPMNCMRENQLDAIVAGEITEWTTSAYIRDASDMGMNRGMIILGHERSEEAGMKYLGEWLKDIFADIPIVFIDSGEPFYYL
jgi:putative NIF3 family GTP cyclohydrolase 1 type 2